jgi:signal transduction histidine kinase
MAPEVLTRATELFFTTKAADQGTGLGLFLALEFADHAGGKLLLQSEAGRGTKARLVFPPAR